MRSKKIIRIVIGVFLFVLLAFIGFRFIRNSLNRSRLLKAVHLENTAGLRQIDYCSWTDPLQYKDGFEIMAFSADKQSFRTPEEWIEEPKPLDLSELEASLHIVLDYGGILGLSLGGDVCSAWFFAEGRDAGKPFEQREYYLGYLYDNYGEPLIFIYHGHHLYGIE
ncbi:MAG: hypothetical protein IK099_05190 [Clostridia bacterium]|nr:hypothetical protein [Clostridia bacterium]